jgi:hypothetical protein
VGWRLAAIVRECLRGCTFVDAGSHESRWNTTIRMIDRQFHEIALLSATSATMVSDIKDIPRDSSMCITSAVNHRYIFLTPSHSPLFHHLRALSSVPIVATPHAPSCCLPPFLSLFALQHFPRFSRRLTSRMSPCAANALRIQITTRLSGLSFYKCTLK